MNKARYYITLLVSLLLAHTSYGQDLEKIKKEDWLNYRGGISFSQVFYQAYGQENERDPYFWQLNANVSLSLLNVVRIPFSLQLAKERKDFNYGKPFNQFGLSPEYRSIKLHLGYRSLRFSDYTLNGNLFYGIGLEYESEVMPVLIKTYYGRFSRPVEKFIAGDQQFEIPVYERKSWGIQAGYRSEGNQLLFSILHSSDDPNSIGADSLAIRPEENLVLGVLSSFQLSEQLRFDAEYAYSLLTRNILSEYPFVDEYSFHNNLGSLFTPNSTSTFAGAFNGTLSFSTQYFTLNTRYRRIEPDFITHGSSFLNNDLSDLTVGISMPLLKNSLNLSGNVGIKRNNLDRHLQREVRSLAYSFAANYRPGKHTLINTSLNNFNTSSTQQVFNADLISDSLTYFQLNSNKLFTVSQMMGAKRETQLSLTANLQEITNSENQPSTNINLTSSASFKATEQLKLGINVLYNKRTSIDSDHQIMGPAVKASYVLSRLKLRTGAQFRIARNYIQRRFYQQIMNLRIYGQVKLFKNQSIMLNGNFSNRLKTQSNVFEQRVSMVYNWSF